MYNSSHLLYNRLSLVGKYLKIKTPPCSCCDDVSVSMSNAQRLNIGKKTHTPFPVELSGTYLCLCVFSRFSNTRTPRKFISVGETHDEVVSRTFFQMWDGFFPLNIERIVD